MFRGATHVRGAFIMENRVWHYSVKIEFWIYATESKSEMSPGVYIRYPMAGNTIFPRQTTAATRRADCSISPFTSNEWTQYPRIFRHNRRVTNSPQLSSAPLED